MQRLIKKRTTLWFTVITGGLFLTGCAGPARLAETGGVVPPGHFAAGYSDSSGAAFNVRQIFSDKKLASLLDSAVRNNSDVLIAAERIELARAHFRMRRGAMFPVIEATARASGNRYGDYTMEGVGNFDTNLSGNIDEDQKAPVPFTPDYFIGLQSSWEIDLWGKLKNRRRAAYLRVLASEQGKALVTTSIVAEVASRYYLLQSLDAELEVLKRNIVLQDSAVRIAEIQKEAGRTTELGVQQFKAQLMRTRGLEARVEQQIIQVENELNFVLGRFPQRIERSAGFQRTQVVVPAAPGLPVRVLGHRPDVLQAELDLRAAKADVAAAQAALLPSLTLSPFAGYNSFNTSLLFNPGSLAYGLIGGLTAPLLNRSVFKGELSRSRADKQLALHQYNKVVLGAFSEIETSYSSLANLQRELDWNSRESGILQEAVHTSNELYMAGYASYLEVITAQRNAIDAQIAAIQTKANMHYSLINLYRSLGGGWD